MATPNTGSCLLLAGKLNCKFWYFMNNELPHCFIIVNSRSLTDLLTTPDTRSCLLSAREPNFRFKFDILNRYFMNNELTLYFITVIPRQEWMINSTGNCILLAGKL